MINQLITQLVEIMDETPVMPLWLSLIAGFLFLGTLALSVWGFLHARNNALPKHVTEEYPFFKRAFAEGKPILYACFGTISLLKSIAFFIVAGQS